MTKTVYYLQNDGHLERHPPDYLGRLAKACWRKVVPFLESTKRVQRIDTALVEQYCSEYEIYREAYKDIQKNGIQTKTYASLQDSTGAIIGKGGNRIRSVRQNSGADISIDSAVGPGNERIITIKGTQQQIHFAHQMLRKRFVFDDRLIVSN